MERNGIEKEAAKKKKKTRILTIAFESSRIE